MDWIEDKAKKSEHDFDSSMVGGNRFATILMYMSDLGPDDGGETVFPKAWPHDVDESDRIEPEVVRIVERCRRCRPFLTPTIKGQHSNNQFHEHQGA